VLALVMLVGSRAEEESHVTLCDSLFFALDGRQIGDGPESWVAHVTAVREIGGHFWIQLEEAGNPARSLVLRVTPDATVDQVIATLMMTDGEHIADFVPVFHAA
jgi:hypothetical protein